MILDKTEFDDVVWNGDLNMDCKRSSGFSKVMKNFLVKIGLFSLWDHYPIDFTHIHTDGKSVSTLDHFLVNEGLLPLVTECKVLHRGDNMSRHSPIILKLDIGALPCKQKSSSWLPKKPAWYKANLVDIEKYKSDLQDKLESLPVVESLCCSNPKYQDMSHSGKRDSMVLDILVSIIEASHATIPMAGGRRADMCKPGTPRSQAGSIPGWNEEVEPFRDEALFSHSVWVSSGRPNKGNLHIQMAKSRNQYHYAVRRAEKHSDLTKAKKLF